MRRIAALRFAKNCPASRVTIQKLKHCWPRALGKRDQRHRAAMRGDAGLRHNAGGHRMRKSPSKSLLVSLLAAAALGAVFLLGAPANEAAAMMSATPNQIGVPSSDDTLVQKAALVCGRLGCRRVWVGRRAWWGAHRAAWWGPRRVAWWHRGAWWGPRRVAWGPRRYWWETSQLAWRPRPLYAYAGARPLYDYAGSSPPLYAYAGPSAGWGWGSPGWSVGSWGWGGSGWGWSGWGGRTWSVGWGSGRPWWGGWGGW